MSRPRQSSQRSPFIAWFEDCNKQSTELVGGKCSSLGELLRVPVPVPTGFAVTTEAHRTFLGQGDLVAHAEHLLSTVDMHDPPAVRVATLEVRKLFETATIPAAVDEAIRRTYQELSRRCGAEDLPVAVRSSATAEDLVSASFAGQLETYLWITGADAVVAHTARCWSALFEPHAAQYCQQLGVAYDQVYMSVAVQQMVDARSAGVMFTLNPLNADRSKIIVESCWGLGEGIVSGEVTPDRFIIDKVMLQILDSHTSAKEFGYQLDPWSGKVANKPITTDRVYRPSVSEAEVLELAGVGKQIERHYQHPQDIEWVFGRTAGTRADEQFYILQSRPETVASQRSIEPIMKPRKSAVEHVVDDMVARGGTRKN